MFKILNITNSEIYIHIFNKFGFRQGAFNPNKHVFPLYFLFWETVFLLFKCTKIDWSGSKWTEWIEYEQSGPNGPNRTEVDKLDQSIRIGPMWTE